MDRLRNLMLSEDLEEITSHLRTIIDKGKMGELYDEILMEAVNSRNQKILKLILRTCLDNLPSISETDAEFKVEFLIIGTSFFSLRFVGHEGCLELGGG